MMSMTLMQRLKIAFHYLLPQQGLTVVAGWLARREWGVFTHGVIALFARVYRIRWDEAALEKPSDYASFNAFFTRALKPDVRPVVSEAQALCLPADGRVNQAGHIAQGRLLQAKGHEYSLLALLGGNAELAAQFDGGCFVTTYLSPRDYHQVHMPCDATLRRTIYVPGDLFSVSPLLAEHVPGLFARNERLIALFDTPFGPMAQILIGATITGSISTRWAGVLPRRRVVDIVDYPATDTPNAIRFAKGEAMGAFLLGSTVVNLFAPQAVTLSPELVAGAPTTMGQLLGHGQIEVSAENRVE